MKKFREWKMHHPLLYVVGFLVIYLGWFLLLERYRHPVLIVHTTLDDFIPFCEYFIIPYLLWFVWSAGTFIYFYFHSTADFYNLCRGMFTGLLLCLFIYTVVPTGLHLRTEIVRDNIFAKLVTIIYSVDTSTNVCPSIHVFVSVVLNRSIWRYKNDKKSVLVCLGSAVLMILVCLSTVFLKQHSVLDVFWGVILGVMTFPLLDEEYKNGTLHESDCKVFE